MIEHLPPGLRYYDHMGDDYVGFRIVNEADVTVAEIHLKELMS